MLAGKPGSGGFAAAEKLRDREGNILRLGQYWDYDARKWTGVETSEFKEHLGIGAAAVDWDDDGDLDLVLGSFQGNFYVRLNEGSAREPAFATKSIVVEHDGEPVAIPGRDAIPEIVDWDGDGRFDILSGSGAGGVYWVRNIGTKKGEPEFAKPVALLGPSGNSSATAPGRRTQVCVTDYDDDGDLDLLVGDYTSTGGKRHGFVWLVRQR